MTQAPAGGRTFPQNRLDALLRPIVGIYHGRKRRLWCKKFKLIKMKHILQLLQVKQVEDVLLLYLKFTYVANALTIMMSLKIFAPRSFFAVSSEVSLPDAELFDVTT